MFPKLFLFFQYFMCLWSPLPSLTGVMMLQLLEKVIELENWTEGKGVIVCGAKNTFSSGSDLNAVKALGTPEDGMAVCMFMQNTLTRFMSLTHSTWKFLSQGLNLSDSCSIAVSFNPLCWAKDGTCASEATPATAVRFLTYCTTVGTSTR